MIKKLIMFGLIFLVCLSGVFAYEQNEEIVINANYKEDGINVVSAAVINIYLPNGTLDISENMTVIGIGNFYYLYSSDVIGEHTAISEFYVDASVSGYDTETFIVSSSGFNFATCPSNDRQWSNFWLMIGFIIAFVIIGFIASSPITMMISGGVLTTYSVIIAPCISLIAYLFVLFGLMCIMYGIFMKPKSG